ncbi:uncharacterized protein [Montipora capricornis]|uniref:uncharacterized protein n=1 Tax=Montipora capricornis TaxID=246305 RepID=UPI0035F1C55D
MRAPIIFLVLAVILTVTGTICLITGIVLLTKSKSPSCDTKEMSDRCSSSDEASRSGLDTFLQIMQDSYFRLHPNKIAYKPGVTPSEIREKYRSYDPSPANIKYVTDEAWRLLDEANKLDLKVHKLKQREKKALSQVKHYLQHIFGTPYEANYYAGDFLLGPNLWCWQPLCDVPYEIMTTMRHFKPNTTKALENLKEKLAEIKETFHQYIRNMKYGVAVGMVRSIEQCKAGINGLTATFRKISAYGAMGIFEEAFVKLILHQNFIATLANDPKESILWERKYGKSVNESLREFVLDYIGKPIDDLFTYVRKVHIQYCVSSKVSSGLASLPLPFVYVNNTPDESRPTNKSLPTGELLNGTKSYELIVTYFTTNSLTPDEINQMGYEMLKELYPKVLETARMVTKESNNDTAKDKFIQRMNHSDMYFIQEEIPQNESNERAYMLCGDVESAKKYCPTRWRAMENWFAETRMVFSLLDPKTINMFYFSGPKHTTPNCPIDFAPDFNPSTSANYGSAGKDCKQNAHYYIPFFLERPGPKYEEWSTSAHEGRPGHHTQVQGLAEHFIDKCGGIIKWLDEETGYTAFSEGWALYAEDPLIGEDTDTYKNEPWPKYGMLKWQIWRALRLIVDSGLHFKGYSRQESLHLFAKFAWDESETALNEVTRYQSAPGQATAYMIGQQHIKKLRNDAKMALGDKFDLRDFHYHLLSQGSSPLSHLEQSINTYINCVKNEKDPGCDDILNPVQAEDKDGAEDESIYRPIRRHYF